MRFGYGKPAVDFRTFQAEASRYATVIFLPSLLRVYLKESSTVNESLILLPSGRKSPPPKLLSSDDESSPPTIPSTLRSIPHFYPNLPPKHTYLRTPVYISTLVQSHVPHRSVTAFTAKEASVAILREEIEKCKPGSGVATKSSLSDRRRRWAR